MSGLSRRLNTFVASRRGDRSDGIGSRARRRTTSFTGQRLYNRSTPVLFAGTLGSLDSRIKGDDATKPSRRTSFPFSAHGWSGTGS